MTGTRCTVSRRSIIGEITSVMNFSVSMKGRSETLFPPRSVPRGMSKAQGDSELKGRVGNIFKTMESSKRTNERHSDNFMIT